MDKTYRPYDPEQLLSAPGGVSGGNHKVIVACTPTVFDLIKRARGFRQFLLRNLVRDLAGWALICTGSNLPRLWRSGRWGGADPHGSPLSSARSERACV
jgi:hypothetical protein